jgi:Survival motor neuron (SMN) interacting protein 1 (SIP1)
MFNTHWFESSGSLSTSRSRWIYALLARLETPVYQDTVAILRQLYRRCCLLRAGLGKGEVEEQLARLNILIVLTGAFFGQGGEEYAVR